MDAETAFENSRRRNTLCPAELQRGRFSHSNEVFSENGIEEEKMAFERSVARVPGKPPRIGLSRVRKRFPTRVCNDDLRFRDVLWRSAVFSMYSAEERRQFVGEARRFRGGGGGGGGGGGVGFLSLEVESAATSSDRIGGGLGPEQTVAWEMFTPLQRVLVLAVAASAAANSKHLNEVERLKRSVEDRDQTLDVMQHTLNDLWERIFFLQVQSGITEKNKESGGVKEREDCTDIVGLGTPSSWESCEIENRDVSSNGNRKKEVLLQEDPSHAPCAAAIIELKRRTECILEKEASNVMSAFASVLEKVEDLESSGTIQMNDGKQNKAKGFALQDLKVSVEQASAQITSLQMSLFDIWHTLLPEALCAVNVSPSELDHYLDKAKKESCMVFPTRQFNFQEWKQWLNAQEHGFIGMEANILSTVHTEEDGYFYKMPLGATEQEERRLSDMSDWSSSIASMCDQSNVWASFEADAASAIVAAVKKTVDKIIAPLDAQKAGCTDGSQDMVVEKLLCELDTAATKVANMESELVKLKEYIKICDNKRKGAEEKLADAVKQGIQNQLNFTAKEEEIARLHKDCKRKDAIIKELTSAAQRSKDASSMKLNVLEEVCKKKNSTIKKLKEEVASLEEKVSQLMKLKVPPSLIWNNEASIPPVMSTNFLFDMDMPSSPESSRMQNSSQNLLTPSESQDEYSTSSSQGLSEVGNRTSVQSTASSPTTGRYRRVSTENSRSSSPTSVRFTRMSTENSRSSSPSARFTRGMSAENSRTSSPPSRYRGALSSGNSRSSSPNSSRFRRDTSGNQRTGRHSSKVNVGQSSSAKLRRSNSDVRFMNENTKSNTSCTPKLKNSSSGVLSGVDTNLKSRGSSESEEGQRNARTKSKDNAVKKRWV